MKVVATLTEEHPDYPARVAEFLAKSGRRRLPWGDLFPGSGLVRTRSTREIQARHEMGEVAIAVLGALGVSEEMIDRLADLPHDTTGEALVAEMERLRAAAPATLGDGTLCEEPERGS